MEEMVKKLNKICNRVEHILQNNYEARDDDRLLYYLVCKQICSEQDMNIDRLSFKSVMMNKNIKLPNYESVRRSRQKIQEANPSLWGDRKMEREALQEAYKKFSTQ